VTQFWGLQQLTAASIEAPEANDGQVITARSGRAAWENATGGVFDTVVFTITSGYIRIDLQSGGVTVTNAAFFCFVTAAGSPEPTDAVTLEGYESSTSIVLQPLINQTDQKMVILAIYDSSDPRLSTYFTDPAGIYYLNVILPSGAIAISGALENPPDPNG
jgi:hypothetical protein